MSKRLKFEDLRPGMVFRAACGGVGKVLSMESMSKGTGTWLNTEDCSCTPGRKHIKGQWPIDKHFWRPDDPRSTTWTEITGPSEIIKALL